MIEDKVQEIKERMQKILESTGENAMEQNVTLTEVTNALEINDTTNQMKPEESIGNQRQVDNAVDVIAWASQLAERDLILQEPVSYTEAELCTVTTTRVSWYAVHYLSVISYARLQQHGGGWGIFTSQWWQEREKEALFALANLKESLKGGLEL